MFFDSVIQLYSFSKTTQDIQATHIS